MKKINLGLLAGSLSLFAPLITFAAATCKVNGQIVPCPDISSMLPGVAGTGIFALFSIILPLIWLAFVLIMIGGSIFWVFMLVHAAKHDIKDKTTWVLIVALTHIVGAVIYYFMVKKPFDAMVLANGGVVPQSAPVTASVPVQVPGSVATPIQSSPITPQSIVATKSSAFSITALVLGIATFVPVAGFICGIGAIIFGFIARSKVKQGTGDGKGMALAGIILGFAGIILWILIGLLPVLFLIMAAGSK